MTKKTFETTVKHTITTSDLVEAASYHVNVFHYDEDVFKKFSKTYDWDAILTGNKFGKFVETHIKNEPSIATFEVCDLYFEENPKESDKVEKAYIKYVDDIEKKEPTIKSKYCLTFEGKKSNFEKVLNTIKAMSDVTIECL